MLHLPRLPLLVLVSVFGLLALPVNQAAAQSPPARSPAADSAMVRYAGMVIIEKLAYTMSAAAHDTTRQWWTMEFPESTVPGMWAELRDHLTAALRARDSLPGDSTRGLILVRPIGTLATEMTFEVVVGGAQLCEGSWRGNDQSYLVRSEWSGGTWMYPSITRGAHGYSSSCR